MAARRFGVACLATLVALALVGCVRQTATYTVGADDTVSGRIYKALHEDYIDPAQPYKGTGVGDIAATFSHATITAHDEGEWIGYYVDFVDEPLASFADPVTDNWDIQILKTDATYRAYGYTPTSGDDGLRTTIDSEDGYLELWVTFPGALVEAPAAAETGLVGSGPASWAFFNLITIPIDTTPYARGMGASGPDPGPDPDPVVTVVITPHPDPEPVVTPSPTSTPSPSDAVIAPPAEEDAAIPGWIWLVGGALVVALAGLIGYTAANRKSKVAEAAASAKAEGLSEENPKK